MNCANCGFPMMPVYSGRDGWREVCMCCGRAEACRPVPGLSEEAGKFAQQGWNFFEVQRFNSAGESFQRAVEAGKALPEYLWAALLAKYGVRYCGLGGGKYAVNFWRRDLPEALLSEDGLFRELSAAAAMEDGEALRRYFAAAEDIDRGLRQIARTRDDPCDVFISLKERDERGRTPESELCDGLYVELTVRGLQVFYAPKTLGEKIPSDFEGYIHSALRNAKVLLIVTSSRRNVSAPWVRSEWRRFQSWNAGEDERLMTCRVGEMRAEDFPPELSRYQHALCAELDQLQQRSTIGWISGEVEKRCRILQARTRKDPPEPAPPEPAPPEPMPPEPVPPEPAPPRHLSELEQLEARARGGDAEAQWALGERYARSEGVAQDWAEAAKWYRRAAERGHAEAQCALGDCCREGRGVKKDFTEAAKWYRQAAEQGHAEAQCALGDC